MRSTKDLTPTTADAVAAMLERIGNGRGSSRVLLLPWIVEGEPRSWSDVGAWCRSASPDDLELDDDDGFSIEVEGQRIYPLAPDVRLGGDDDWRRFIDLLLGAAGHGDGPYWYCPGALYAGFPRPWAEQYTFDDYFSVHCYTTSVDVVSEWLWREISAGVQADEAAGWLCVLHPLEPGVVLTGPDALLDEAATIYESVPVQSATTRGIFKLMRSRGWPNTPLDQN